MASEEAGDTVKRERVNVKGKVGWETKLKLHIPFTPDAYRLTEEI